MAPLKPLLVATAGFVAAALLPSQAQCAGDSCETGDQTALLQSHLSRKSDLSLSEHSAHTAALFPKLSHLNDPHTRRAALLEMEKTAIQLAHMDRSEATPVVVTVCRETADLLNTTVLYAIIEEDAADRANLQSAYDRFGPIEDMRNAAETIIQEAQANVTSAANSLANCRRVEEEICVNLTVCTTHVDADCDDRDRIERELQEIDETIHNAWCESGQVRTSVDFRTMTVTLFHRYTQKLTELERAELGCDEAHEECEDIPANYVTTATSCNVKQSTLIGASCSAQHSASLHLTLYQQEYDMALDAYNDLVATVMVMEADRKVEWDVLTRVICLLLTLTQEATEEGDLEHGLVSSEETEARIERCWTDDVDVSHLDIDYLEPPPKLTIPDLPPLPCTAEYDDHYNLGPPAVCAAHIELHNTQANSECNCLADELAEQGLVLGHYLLVDPAVPMTVAGGDWTISLDGEAYSGTMSAIHEGNFAALSAEMLTAAELDPQDEDYTGEIAAIAWAYPSTVANWAGPMSLGQRFASRGGMVFMNAAHQVIDVRELASSSGPLGQPVSATLSFSSAEEVTPEAVTAACPYMHAVAEGHHHYAQGAREYCWAMGGEHISQCGQGCFIYKMVYGDVVFPLIEGMHIA